MLLHLLIESSILITARFDNGTGLHRQNDAGHNNQTGLTQYPNLETAGDGDQISFFNPIPFWRYPDPVERMYFHSSGLASYGPVAGRLLRHSDNECP